MEIREHTDEDIPILVQLINEAFRDTYEFIPYTEERLKREQAERGGRFLIAEEGGRVRGFAAHFSGRWGDEIKWLFAFPGPRKREIEDALVKKIEEEAKSDRVFVRIDASDPGIGDWERRGYAHDGGMYHMTASLDRPRPLPPLPEGVVLRSLRPGEEDALIRLVNMAYGWERLWPGVIERWKARDPLFDESWVHVAEHEGKLVAVVVSRRDVEYNAYFGAKRGYLGPAATLPDYRRMGLATALTCRAMNFLREKGMDSVALHTMEDNVAAITLLKKLGFQIRHHWLFLAKRLAKGA